VPKDAVAPKSHEISLEGAAVSGLAYVTAGSAFTESGGISTGETILVTGAAGGVGSAAVMIARWKGARVIGAIKDQTERARAERAGVEVIVDTSREDIRSRTPLIQVARCRTRQYTVLARKLR
jgi:NADPH:quinone reductase